MNFAENADASAGRATVAERGGQQGRASINGSRVRRACDTAAAMATHDPELTSGPPMDLHSLRANNKLLDSLVVEISKRAAAQAAAAIRATAEGEALAGLGRAGKVLVTGSAGYLGAALCLALELLDIDYVGVDIVRAPTVHFCHDVVDASSLQTSARGCVAILHTAALHAPHANLHHAEKFQATNVEGTKAVLSLGLPVVHTSTTSLTITARVKEHERQGELVWLDHTAMAPTAETDDAPRNKYGRTKLAAERACVAAAAAGLDVVILRAPRFFAEDTIEPTSEPLPSIKANELLGRRVALVDLVDAELRALARVRALRGRCLTICAPTPLDALEAKAGLSAAAAATRVREKRPVAEAIFAARGWRLADVITRVYDPSAAMDALSWRPRVTFDSVLRVLAAGGAEEEDEGARSRAGGESAETEIDDAVALEAVLQGAF